MNAKERRALKRKKAMPRRLAIAYAMDRASGKVPVRCKDEAQARAYWDGDLNSQVHPFTADGKLNPEYVTAPFEVNLIKKP